MKLYLLLYAGLTLATGLSQAAAEQNAPQPVELARERAEFCAGIMIGMFGESLASAIPIPGLGWLAERTIEAISLMEAAEGSRGGVRVRGDEPRNIYAFLNETFIKLATLNPDHLVGINIAINVYVRSVARGLIPMTSYMQKGIAIGNGLKRIGKLKQNLTYDPDNELLIMGAMFSTLARIAQAAYDFYSR